MNNRFKEAWYLWEQIGRRSMLSKMYGMLRLLLKEGYGWTEKGKPDAGTLFFISHARSDYRVLLDRISDACGTDKMQIYIERKGAPCTSLKILSGLLRKRAMFKETGSLMLSCGRDESGTLIYRKVSLGFIDRLYLYLFYLAKAEIVETIAGKYLADGHVGKIIVLCDTWPIEQLLAEAAHELQTSVYACQHGIFMDSAEEAGTLDLLNLTELPSDKYLLWGDYTKEKFQKYNPGLECAVCGNPLIDETRTTPKLQGLWGIAMDWPKFHVYNQKMISEVESCAKRCGAHIRIRLHPQEFGREDTYVIDGSVSEFNRDIDAAEIIFGHSSSMMFTYMVQGYAVFKFESDVRVFNFGREFVFSNADELMEHISNISQIDFRSEGKRAVSYCGKDSMEKYREVITGED